MAYESFYGGRPGAPFVIVKKYPTEIAMNTEFDRGAALTHEVNYGEYVVIDDGRYEEETDNGKVYRRGMEGAEYIGQFIGPKGEPGGIHIVGRVDNYSDLNGETPESIGGGEEYKGWVVAVGLEGNIPDLYAYDYIKNEWFYIGSMPYTLITTQRTHV